MTSVLFVDIDGVLNSNISYAMKRTIPAVGFNVGLDQFDPRACALMARIQKVRGFEIVISSTWRHIAYLPQFQRWFGAHGMTILDTCDHTINEKPAAVRKWLGEHPGVTRYAVVDDEPRNVEPFGARGVLTDPEWGLTKAGAKQILQILRE